MTGVCHRQALPDTSECPESPEVRMTSAVVMRFDLSRVVTHNSRPDLAVIFEFSDEMVTWSRAQLPEAMA
jgi:hypothetical protein